MTDAMQAVVEFMLKFSPAAPFPRYFARARRSGVPLGDRFESRLRELTVSLGNPVFESDPAWYPNAEKMACWRRDGKTLALVLERDARFGAAVLLWCVRDSERATLMEAARTRLDRVNAAELDQDFDRQLARIIEPGVHRPLAFKMLVDDLAMNPERADSLLAAKLRDPDGEVRCTAADVRLELGGGLPTVLPLLDDTEAWVRSHVAGLLARYGDDSVVEPLIAKLRQDPDPGVRGDAAYALGHIGSPAAIPQLVEALDHDHEDRGDGHTPSSISATALDNILGTDRTRVRHDAGTCAMAPGPPDHEALKSEARDLYKEWDAGRTHS